MYWLRRLAHQAVAAVVAVAEMAMAAAGLSTAAAAQDRREVA